MKFFSPSIFPKPSLLQEKLASKHLRTGHLYESVSPEGSMPLYEIENSLLRLQEIRETTENQLLKYKNLFLGILPDGSAKENLEPIFMKVVFF